MTATPPPLRWSRHDTPDAALLQGIDDGLDGHNQAFAPLAQVRPLVCAVHAADGKLVGGAMGRTWGRCAELQQLWVDAAWRRRGVARGLMQRFEAAAAERGCTLVYLETFSFQAPAFYASLGFEVTCRIDGFGDGGAAGIFKQAMQKALPPG